MKKTLFFLFFFAFACGVYAQNDTIPAQKAGEFIGQSKWVACQVAGYRVAKEPQKPHFLNIGAAYPNHIFTVVVVGDFEKMYNLQIPNLQDKTIYVFGKIENFKNLPQIKNPEKIILKK